MNLHAIAGPIVGAVNPLIPVTVQISTGAVTADDGLQSPGYATPVAMTASVGAGTGILTVTAIASGTLQPGQTVVGAGVTAGTQITEQLSGTAGAAGTYLLNRAQAAAAPSAAMTTALIVPGQVQPLTNQDLQQVDGINLGGVKWKIYLNGKIDGINRPEKKGGDLLTIATGPHRGVWLTTLVLEQYPDWCSAAIVQQNGS